MGLVWGGWVKTGPIRAKLDLNFVLAQVWPKLGKHVVKMKNGVSQLIFCACMCKTTRVNAHAYGLGQGINGSIAIAT